MSKRVLVVDDEDDIREVAATTLELIGGFEVTTAASGAEALERVKEAHPDAIVLDVMMPGMDGPTTLEHLRADVATAAIPVVFLTAKVQPNDRSRFADLDVSGFIPKPFDPMTFASQLSETLGWSE